MLEIRNISKTFNAGTINEKKALQNLSLTLQDGDFCTVIGGNGAGKSTLMNAVAGVWPVVPVPSSLTEKTSPVCVSTSVHPCWAGYSRTL